MREKISIRGPKIRGPGKIILITWTTQSVTASTAGHPVLTDVFVMSQLASLSTPLSLSPPLPFPLSLSPLSLTSRAPCKGLLVGGRAGRVNGNSNSPLRYPAVDSAV